MSGVLVYPGYEHGVNSLEELAQSQYTPVAHGVVLEQLRIANTSFAKKIISRNTPSSILGGINRIHAMIKFRNMSTNILDSVLTMHDIRNEVKSLGSEYTPIIGSYYILRKYSPFAKFLNLMITKIEESGMSEKWMQDFSIKHFSNATSVKKALSFEHVNAAFYVLVIGHTFSLIIWLFELYRFRFRSM